MRRSLGSRRHSERRFGYFTSGFPADFPADFSGDFPADFPADFPGDFPGDFPADFPADFPGSHLLHSPRCGSASRTATATGSTSSCSVFRPASWTTCSRVSRHPCAGRVRIPRSSARSLHVFIWCAYPYEGHSFYFSAWSLR